MTTTSFRALSPFGDQRETSEVVNNILLCKLNATATVTITNSATSTAVSDFRVGPDSVILFMPTTAAGATELASGSMYVSARAKNTFTITHTSGTATRSFAYVVIG